MLKFILFNCLLFASSITWAHDFFFAFAEVEYNEISGRIEATITVTTHDFEKSLRDKEIGSISLSKAKSDSVTLDKVKQELLKGFSVSLNGNKADFILDGMDVMLNGVTNFYFSADVKTEGINQASIYFGLLMETFPDQQNKATFIARGAKTSLIFLHQLKTQSILLSNEN